MESHGIVSVVKDFSGGDDWLFSWLVLVLFEVDKLFGIVSLFIVLVSSCWSASVENLLVVVIE